MYAAIAAHGVTHMCTAPVLFNILIEGRQERLPSPIHVLTRQRVTASGTTPEHREARLQGHALVRHDGGDWAGDDVRVEGAVGRAASAGARALKAQQCVSALSLAEVDVKDLKAMPW
jgi:hypothetical protein